MNINCKFKSYNCTQIGEECLFREPIVHGICKPDSCEPKIIPNSNRSKNNPLPGKGECKQETTNKISINSLNEPIKNIHDCYCSNKKNCSACTNDRRCAWCNKKGKAGYKRVKEFFNIEKCTENYYSLYKSIKINNKK